MLILVVYTINNNQHIIMSSNNHNNTSTNKFIALSGKVWATGSSGKASYREYEYAAFPDTRFPR